MAIVPDAVRGLALILAALTGLVAEAGTLHPFTLSKQAYPDSRERHYKVYVPDGLVGPAPLVMALHGCEQTNDTVLRDWGLVAAADRKRFILVAPFITSVGPQDGLRGKHCWGFWLGAHRQQGRGEAEDLHQIARQVETRFSVDPERRYVTGLSSGGAMAVVLSVTHNAYFAAAASAAGLPYGEDAASVSLFGGCPGSARFHPVTQVVDDMRRVRLPARAIPLMVLQNNGDCTVLQPAGRNLRDAQLKLDGDAAHDTPSEAQAQQRACSPSFGEAYGCQQIFYTVDGQPGSRSLVETVFYDGPTATPDATDKDHGHYWIGGEHGRDGPYGLRRGPSYPDIVWDFFARHASGPPVNTPNCVKKIAAPGVHLGTGRALPGGFFGWRALASGDRQDIGFAHDHYFAAVPLYQGDGGRWFARPPPGCPA